MFLTLFITGSVFFLFICHGIDKEKNNVIYTEKTISGDRSFAEGINIHFSPGLLGKALWETDYKTGKTDEYKSRFKSVQLIDYLLPLYNDFPHVHLSTGTSIAYKQIYAYEELKGLAEEIEKKVAEIDSNESVFLKVRTKDFFDYYPINFSLVDLNGSIYNMSSLESNKSKLKSKKTPEEKAFADELQEFFRIPVGDDDEITIYTYTTPRGIRPHSVAIYDELGAFSQSAMSDKSAYLSMYKDSGEEKTFDTSQIPGGYGIYKFDYEFTKDYGYSFGKIQNVHPLPDDTNIIEMFFTEDQTKLIFITSEPEGTFFNALNVTDDKLVQKFKITDNQTDFATVANSAEDQIVLDIDNQYRVISVNDDGTFNFEFSSLRRYSTNHHGVYFDKKTGRLFAALMCDGYTGLTYLPDSGFRLDVFTKAGLMYSGTYKSTLSTGKAEDPWSNYYITAVTSDVVISMLD